jgi:hypothetical protein
MSIKTYELMKQEWIRKNPEHTYEQYQQAMREIAKKAGI